MDRGFTPRGLGEIAIRCKDIDAMTRFYRDIIGLEVLSDSRETHGIIFFQIGASNEGIGGHTTILALFSYSGMQRQVHPTSQNPPQTGAGSSLHHFALSVLPQDQDKIIAWYDENKIEYSIEEFPWIGWRGVFTSDPEGNTIELVAHDESWKHEN